MKNDYPWWFLTTVSFVGLAFSILVLAVSILALVRGL